MPKEQGIKDYFKFIRAVFKLTTDCWVNKEGSFVVGVNDEKGEVEGTLKGGPTWRSNRHRGEEDPPQ